MFIESRNCNLALSMLGKSEDYISIVFFFFLFFPENSVFFFFLHFFEENLKAKKFQGYHNFDFFRYSVK